MRAQSWDPIARSICNIFARSILGLTSNKLFETLQKHEPLETSPNTGQQIMSSKCALDLQSRLTLDPGISTRVGSRNLASHWIPETPPRVESPNPTSRWIPKSHLALDPQIPPRGGSPNLTPNSNMLNSCLRRNQIRTCM